MLFGVQHVTSRLVQHQFSIFLLHRFTHLQRQRFGMIRILAPLPVSGQCETCRPAHRSWEAERRGMGRRRMDFLLNLIMEMCFDVDVWYVCVSHVLTAPLFTTHAVDAPAITTQPEAVVSRCVPFFCQGKCQAQRRAYRGPLSCPGEFKGLWSPTNFGNNQQASLLYSLWFLV